MTIAETRSGKVEGLEQGGVHVFRGIPYAAPPVGARRWQPPQREEAWDDVRDATKFSAQSAQTPFPMMTATGAAMPPDSEDSLYLNVYTPACDDKARPVLFWIHGGAFIWGSGDTSWYDGTPFANHGDVVVVTINYRLGPFGFLHLGDLFDGFDGSGNCGILDQIAALEWVRDNIAAFGGNPNDVMIFGESAGGASVGTLLGTPAAKGLFHKAVPQSGAASWIATPEGATDATRQLLANLGVEPGDRDALMAKTTQEIKDAMPPFVENGGNLLPYQPVVDGVVLKEPPLDAIRNGNAEGVHVLVGTNHDEMTLFVAADPQFASLTDEVIASRATTAGFDGPSLVAHFRAQRPDATPAELWLELATQAVFRFPAIALAEAQLAHGPVWMYLFTWGTPIFGGFLKSTHALEIPFVFDQLATPEAKFFTGDGADRQGVADVMHAAWIALARTGSPAHPGLPDWPAYDVTRRATMRFDVDSELLEDPDGAQRSAFAARTGARTPLEQARRGADEPPMDALELLLDESMPAARLGELLREARQRRGWKRKEVAAQTSIDADKLRAYERGTKRVPAEILTRLAGLYGDDLSVPVREPVAANRDWLVVGAYEQPLMEGTPEEVILGYIKIVKRLRNAKPGKNLELREADVHVLAQALSSDSDEIERRIADALGCTREEARALHAEMLRRKVLLPVASLAVGVAAFAGFAHATEANAEQPEPARVEELAPIHSVWTTPTTFAPPPPTVPVAVPKTTAVVPVPNTVVEHPQPADPIANPVTTTTAISHLEIQEGEQPTGDVGILPGEDQHGPILSD